MADTISMQFTGYADVLKKLAGLTDGVTKTIKDMYAEAAGGTYDDSQAAVPVDTGNLRDSASITIEDKGHKWSYEVNYGDVTGGSSTPKKYSYTTTTGPVRADGYAWFVELGHLSRAGNPVPAQPYLGPAFYTRAEKLIGDLKAMFD